MTTTRGRYSARLEVHAPMTQAEKKRMDASDARDRKRALNITIQFKNMHQPQEVERLTRLWKFTAAELDEAQKSYDKR